MRLIAKSGDVTVNIHVDEVERDEDVVFAYRDGGGVMEFAGMFSLGSMDYIYISEGRT